MKFHISIIKEKERVGDVSSEGTESGRFIGIGIYRIGFTIYQT